MSTPDEHVPCPECGLPMTRDTRIRTLGCGYVIPNPGAEQ